ELIEGLTLHEPLPRLPRGPRRFQRGGSALDELEHALGEAAPGAPDRAPLGREITRDGAEIEHRLVPHRPHSPLAPAAAEGDEMHGYSSSTPALRRAGKDLPAWRAISSSSFGSPKRTSSSTTCTSRTSAGREAW